MIAIMVVNSNAKDTLHNSMEAMRRRQLNGYFEIC